MEVISSGIVHADLFASAMEEAASITSSEFHSQKEARILRGNRQPEGSHRDEQSLAGNTEHI